MGLDAHTVIRYEPIKRWAEKKKTKEKKTFGEYAVNE